MPKSIPSPLPALSFAAVLALSLSAPVSAQFKAENCADYTASEFVYRKLVTRSNDSTIIEPIKMAVDARPDGRTDLYFVERHGKVKRWNGASNTVTLLTHLDVWSDSPEHVDSVGPEAETGLEGIVLDRDFADNHRLYLRYEPFSKEVYRISRFTVAGDSLAGEKVILEIPYVREHTHKQAIVIGGSGLDMDDDGNLYIAVGANSELSPSVNEKYRDFSAEYTASNLASLRGAILKIHPDDSPRGYSIPKGNFGEYFSEWFAKQGKASLAAAYADTSKVKAEVYVKGVRNPYSLSVDAKTGWVLWGEFGPNRMGATRIEEDNVATHPAYEGYPYWSGKNEFLLDGLQPWAGAGLDPKAPVNNSVWNEGPKELPPADTPRYAYSAGLNNGFLVGNHPTSGPIYRYNPESGSPYKLPPHFDGAWFVVERQWGGMRIFRLSDDGARVIDSVALMTSVRWDRPLDLKIGADGGVYVLDYGGGWHAGSPLTSIGRIEYTGTCRPGVAAVLAGRNRGANLRAKLSGRILEVKESGPHLVRIHDFSGRVFATLRGDGPMSHALPGNVRRGMLFVTVETPKASRTFATADL
jgi:cytochrome c